MKTKDFLDFYTNIEAATDYKNRTFKEILSSSDLQLERSHDFIQLLFPLPERSLYNSNAPIVDAKILHAFRTSSQLRANLRLAFHRMLRFYGFKLATPETPIKIIRAENYTFQAQNWVQHQDHNHQRITRMLRSLRLLGLEEDARAFYEVLEGVYNDRKIGQKSFVYWRRAAFRPLHVAPHVESVHDEVADELLFLKDIEEVKSDS